MLMGLNLVNVLPVSFPSLNVDVRDLPVPPVVTAYAAGLTFALAASPCSTPILAAILAFAATQNSPLLGASLLFTYSAGYIAPVIVAATATVRAPKANVLLSRLCSRCVRSLGPCAPCAFVRSAMHAILELVSRHACNACAQCLPVTLSASGHVHMAYPYGCCATESCKGEAWCWPPADTVAACRRQ